jgi:AcrR family transcriptional regulator
VSAAPTTRERQKADRRQRILRAGLELMRQRGFSATTYEQIAAQAGVSRGTVFNYFPYKESILLDYAAEELAQLDSRVELQRARDPQWTSIDELRYLFDELGAFVERQRELLLPLSYELLNPDPDRSRAAFLALPLGRMLQSALERGRDEGQVRADHSVERLGRTLANTYFMTALHWSAYRSDRPLQAELRLALSITLEGLLHRPQADPT